jgi:hypothetical protein
MFGIIATMNQICRWWVSLKGTGFSPYIKGNEINGALALREFAAKLTQFQFVGIVGVA